MTMGEGGAVNVVHKPALKSYAESFRDWGRDCWCASGKDDTCGRRFAWQQGELPAGYDHKYIYSHLGYNLKPLDPQAAIGRVQLRRLPAFIEARKRNWMLLRERLDPLNHIFDFALPTHARGWEPQSGFSWDTSGCSCDSSWFGFMLRVKPTASFTAVSLAKHLEAHRIGNRMLFGGNLTKQPAFISIARERPGAFRKINPLSGANNLMETALFIGTYPGLSEAMIDYTASVITRFVSDPTRS
jgi:CDP-6-deoxy-D-xylo-4-hexulose-3-dehydrase